jgi:hypothetical protein
VAAVSSGGSASSGSSSAKSPSSAGATTPPPTPTPGTITGLPTLVVLTNDGEANGFPIFPGSFTFTAAGGPVSYTVSEPAAEQAFWTMTIGNGSGTLPAGQQATITVSLISTGVTDTESSLPYVTVNGTTVEFRPVLLVRR